MYDTESKEIGNFHPKDVESANAGASITTENGMQNCKDITERITRRVACVIALGMALTIAMPQLAHADDHVKVPPEIQVPGQARLVFVGHGVGTQNYVCVPSATGVAFTLFTPQATLFNDDLGQITTHFFSPNPFESGIIRVTWESSQDTSTVWGQVIGSSTDPRFVTPGAIPWLLVQIVGAQEGPTGGTTLLGTSFIQRLNTVGGAAPAKDCKEAKDIGTKAFVPYTADYFFYQNNKP